MALLSVQKPNGDLLAGLVQVMRKRMLLVKTVVPVLDIVGTGGDQANTVNLSTGAALLAASCGVHVAKHGNRSVSSQCGSADLLEAFGIPFDRDPIEVAKRIEEEHFGFLYAPYFHPLMKQLAEIRKSLGFPTCYKRVFRKN